MFYLRRFIIGTANTADYVPTRPKILQKFKREYETPGPRTKDEEQQPANGTKHKKTTKASGEDSSRSKTADKKSGKGTKAKTSDAKTSVSSSHIQTQTDWSWIQDMQIMEKIRRGNSISPTTSCGEISFCSCLKELNGFCFRLQQFRGC